MRLPSLKDFFGRVHEPTDAVVAHQVASAPLEAVATEHVVRAPTHRWTAERMAVSDALWGEGFQFPGGEPEVLRLAKPLGVSKAASLMLLGGGSGGAACSLVGQLGVWVNGFEADPDLAEAAIERANRANLGKKANNSTWNAANPVFTEHYYHHVLALEPLRGAAPEIVLASLSHALKPGGQLMLVELVADAPLDPDLPLVAEWFRLEQLDPAHVPSEIAITRVLGRLGFDVRIVEDVSQRHMHQILMGWRRMVRSMEAAKPSRREAMLVVNEAQLWLLRVRLFREKRLRLVRWHAIGRASG